MTAITAWPRKIRELHNHHFDSTEDVAEYEVRAVQELGPECARWLATGEGLD